MCRHVGYLGEPIAPAEVLLDAPHSLLVQSYAPADMRCGATMNADGFGLGWYPGDGAEPVRYRQPCPLWTDTNVASFGRAISTGALVAAVRSATVGMPVVETACAPFVDGRWLFSHNGVITGWPHSVAEIAAELPAVDLLTMEAPTDSALLWALLRRRLHAGEAPEAAMSVVVQAVAGAAPESRLNLLLTDGTMMYATTWAHSLSVLHREDAVVVSSEPLDDRPEWQRVDDGQLLIASKDEVRTHPLSPTRGFR
ncbi:MAG: ergothioneine biosynthesis protein EgtC [Pseudonocardiaceae bacterium]|nr:ergothioneine biosynthesis protein EgtC [Pseudonocardiaceae bacterium]